MSSPNFDIAFVAALEKILSNGHRDGRPNDAQCMIIGINQEQIQDTFEVIEQFHQMARRTGQEGRFRLKESPFDLYLCRLPDGFTEAQKMERLDHLQPTLFEAAFHQAEQTRQAQLLKPEMAETMAQQHLLTRATNWPSEIGSPNARDLMIPFRVFPENGGVERQSTLGMSLLGYHHLLTATLLEGPEGRQEQVQKLIRQDGDGGHAVLGLLEKGRKQVSLDPQQLFPFLEHSSNRLREQTLRLLCKLDTDIRLDSKQLTTLLQEDNQQIRQLATRLSGYRQAAPENQGGRSR